MDVYSATKEFSSHQNRRQYNWQLLQQIAWHSPQIKSFSGKNNPHVHNISTVLSTPLMDFPWPTHIVVHPITTTSNSMHPTEILLWHRKVVEMGQPRFSIEVLCSKKSHTSAYENSQAQTSNYLYSQPRTPEQITSEINQNSQIPTTCRTAALAVLSSVNPLALMQSSIYT